MKKVNENAVREKITTKGYAYQSYLDVKEGTSFENGLDEAIDNAIDAKAKNILLVVDSVKRTATIYDDGKGMDEKTLFNVASNAAYHKDSADDEKTIGIRGRGIKNIIAACCKIQQGCTCDIKSSIDGKSLTEVKFNISHEDEDIIHPYFAQIYDFKINNHPFYHDNFIGTEIHLTNIENLNFGQDVINNYGRKYCNDIRDKGINIIFEIDGKRHILKPIDPMFFNGREIDGIEVVDNGGYYLIHEKYTAYNKYDKSDTIDFEIESFCAYDIARFKKFLGKEGHKDFSDGFNINGGIYSKRQNRYMNLGGNAARMFSKNDKLDGNDKEKACGDTSGGNSQYNRICIVIDNNKAAEVFKINSVKSRGIDALSYNENLRDYLLEVNGRIVNVYELIAKIHKFNNRTYKICTGKFKTFEAKYDFVKTYIGEEWDMWDFSAYKPSKQHNSITDIRVRNVIDKINEYETLNITERREDVLNQGAIETKYSIEDKSVFVDIKWKDSVKGETYIISCDVNKNSDLYILMKSKDMTDMIDNVLDNYRDLVQSIIYDHNRNDVKAHLVKYTEVLYKKYATDYED